MHVCCDAGVWFRAGRKRIGGAFGDADLQRLIAHLVVSTGMTWEEVREQFDVPRVKALNAYLEQYPPVHQLVAAYVGHKPKKESSERDLEQLIMSIPETRNG